MWLKLKEKTLPHNTSYDSLRMQLHMGLRKEHGIEGWSDKGPWVNDVFEDSVVYQWEGQMYRRKYKVTKGAEGSDPTVTLGEPKKVHVAYVDSKEAEVAEAVILEDGPGAIIRDNRESDVIITHEGCEVITQFKAKEAKLNKPIQVKIISPGWGSMAYYPEEVLKRDGPTVFPKGTHMMWNHATATEEADRPEGDLSDLAAVLTKDAEWLENGPKGAGLYAEAKVFSDYATQVAEKGPHIGVSINAAIRGHEGEVNGRKGMIADKFVRGFSADFVTKAGAGGAPIVPVTESDRAQIKEGDRTMTDQEITALQAKVNALETENKDLKSKQAVMEAEQNRILAVATVGTALREAGIEFKQSILERACQNPVVKEGALDKEWLTGIVKDFSEGVTGSVTGHGEGSQGTATKRNKEADKQTWLDLGVPEAGLNYAMGGK